MIVLYTAIINLFSRKIFERTALSFRDAEGGEAPEQHEQRKDLQYVIHPLVIYVSQLLNDKMEEKGYILLTGEAARPVAPLAAPWTRIGAIAAWAIIAPIFPDAAEKPCEEDR